MMKIGITRKKRKCYICWKAFCDNKNQKKRFKLHKKVRDHCHFTGKFRGAAQSISNLHYKIPKKIPVKIHHGD